MVFLSQILMQFYHQRNILESPMSHGISWVDWLHTWNQFEIMVPLQYRIKISSMKRGRYSDAGISKPNLANLAWLRIPMCRTSRFGGSWPWRFLASQLGNDSEGFPLGMSQGVMEMSTTHRFMSHWGCGNWLYQWVMDSYASKCSLQRLN